MRHYLLALLVVTLASAIVMADEPPTPQPMPPQPLIAPASPYDHAAAAPDISEQYEHLLQAARHLEAAGLTDDAARIRQKADQSLSKLLAKKQAELDRLKQRIQTVKPAPHQAPPILVKLQVLELSRSKLRELGFDAKSLGPDSQSALRAVLGVDGQGNPSRETFQIGCDDRQGVAGLLKALEQAKVVKVLAEPTLVTVDRRPASYLVGGEVATPRDKEGEIRYRTFGTQLNMLPLVQEDNTLKLDIRARVSQLDPALDTVVDGSTVPGIRAVEVDTALEMRFGQTAVIAGLTQQRREKQVDEKTRGESLVTSEIETVFLVTPELVKGLPPATAASPNRSVPR